MPKTETFDRNLVLEQATEVFHSKGYNGTSMQDLVDATSLNRSSIYNSFGSKLGIFLEVLSFYQLHNTKKISSGLAQTYSATDAIKVIFDIMLNNILNDTNKKGCLLVNCKSEMTNQDPTVKAFIEQNEERMLAMLEDIVSKGQMEKVFNNNQSASQYALYLYASIQGLRMTGILNKNEHELKGIIKTILNTLN
ncbi:TetR/AcrR family transcriptional regulator [Aquimarina pacifica]|uniref:TetR/AcrR family transcriptional regulator n=1 Tax=Aquimarina pacifica TaxID=1296415 RepID=UPI000472EDD0|nr:TetR/AcrR family transcriptional regulator [Aquimarina pacifica]